MKVTNDILKLFEVYAQYKGLMPSTVSKNITGDGGVYFRLSNGRSITIHRYQRIINWFSAHWPADLEWPEDIERPNINNSQGGLASEALPCTSGGNASPPANFNKKKESV